MKIGEIEIKDKLQYTDEHEWILVENHDKARIGITDYAQKSLHEIVFVEVPKVGKLVKQKESIGTAESVKAVSEIFSPLSGQITSVNEKLEMNPELVNKDPYGEGWIAIIVPSDLKKESEKLLNAKQYAEYIRKLFKK